jgi:hypothetical protein
MNRSLDHWLSRRAVLNHDVLCNQLRMELATLRQSVTSPPLRLSQWIKRRGEYAAFLNDAVLVLDPANLLDSRRFSVWSAERRTAMRSIASETFVRISPVTAHLRELQDLLDRCVALASAFIALPPSGRTPDHVAALQDVFDRLSSGISALPEYPGGVLRGRSQ